MPEARVAQLSCAAKELEKPLTPAQRGRKNLQRPTRDKRECQQPHLRWSWLGVQGVGTREVTTATLLPAIPNAAFPLVGVLVSPDFFLSA